VSLNPSRAQPLFRLAGSPVSPTLCRVDDASRHAAIVDLLKSGSRAGVVPFVELVRAALYAPGLGYYVTERARVGRRAEADFTTAAEVGPVFGELVAAAAESLVGDLSGHALVEVGAEPGQSHFSSVASRFGAHLTFRVGEAVAMPPRAVLVANELLDAQPFHRYLRTEGRWVELGVRTDSRELEVVPLDVPSTSASAEFIATLPEAEEGWILDAPLEAEELLRSLLEGGWRGAAVFLDYGRTVAQCLESSPAGTARAYRRHRMSGDILEGLGSQDLTSHVLWDRLEPVMRAAGFSKVKVDRQEAFFVLKAAHAMERLAASGGPEVTGALRTLTHPAHYGFKFQVLHGARRA